MRAVRAGVWGDFDAGDVEGLAARRALVAELGRRLPDAEIIALSPSGPCDAQRLQELARGLDCVVVSGRVPVGSEAEDCFLGAADLNAAGCRVGWSAVAIARPREPARLAAALGAVGRVTVCDPRSREVVAAAGRPTVSVTPHPAFMLPRVCDVADLRQRRDRLRRSGVLSGSALSIIVDAAATSGPWLPGIVEALGAAAMSGQTAAVVVDLAAPSPEGSDLAARVAGQIPGPAAALPAGSGLDDLVALVSSAAMVISGSQVLTALAVGSGVPVLALPGCAWRAEISGVVELRSPAEVYPTLASALRPGGLRVELDGLIAEAELEFDGLQRFIDPSRPTPVRSPIPSSVAELEVQVEQLVARIGAMERDHRTEVEALRRDLDGWRATAERILGSKTWRWSEPARSVVRRVRAVRGS